MATVWEVLGFLRETLLFQSLPLRIPRVEQGALLGMSALCFLLAGGAAEFLILRKKGWRILLPCLWVGALAVLEGLYQLNRFGILITRRGDAAIAYDLSDVLMLFGLLVTLLSWLLCRGLGRARAGNLS